MKRKERKKADAILCADFHLDSSQPPARTDNFEEACWNKLKQVKELQRKHGCIVYHSGDLFDKAKPLYQVLYKTIQHLPDRFHTILGNHDEVGHKISNLDQSGINILHHIGALTILKGTHWRQDPKKYPIYHIENKKLTIWHGMVWKGALPWPNCTDPEIKEVPKMFKKAQIILTGHNHKTILHQTKNQLVLNPGSLMRRKADQQEHKPCVFLYYAEEHKAVPHYLDIEHDVWNTEYLDDKKETEARSVEFLKQLDTDYSIEDSFEINVNKLIQQNKVHPKTEQKINEYMGEK